MRFKNKFLIATLLSCALSLSSCVNSYSTADSSSSVNSYSTTDSSSSNGSSYVETNYTIIWKNWDGSVLETDTNVAYGSTPSYDGPTPTKSGTAQYTYTFSGWSPNVVQVTRDATYTAQFSESINSYTVTWKNWDGSVLETDTNVAYGSTPSYDGPTPTKNDTAQYSYTFSGWSPSVTQVTGDATYTAQFSSQQFNTFSIQYIVIDCDNPNPTLVREGTTVSLEAASKLGYDFIGWYLDSEYKTKPVNKISNINSNYTLYGKFEFHEYQITYHLNGGTNDSANPASIIITDIITLNPAQKTGYAFSGWFLDEGLSENCSTLQNISFDIDLYAGFNANTYSYTLNYQSFEKDINISFHYYSPNSESPYLRAYPVGSSLSYTDLARPSTNEYAFAGWYYDDKYENVFNKNTTISTESLDLYGKWVKHSSIGTYNKSEYPDLTSLTVKLWGDDNASDKSITKKFFVPLNAKISISDCWASPSSKFDFYNVSSGVHTYVRGIDYLPYYASGNSGYRASASVQLEAGAYEMTFSASGLTVHNGSSTTYYGCTAVVERFYTITSKIALSKSFTYSIHYDDELNLPILERKGYKFLGWQDQNGNIISGKYKFTYDISLSVKWSEPIQYKIVYDLDGGCFDNEQPTSYTIEDSSIELATPVKTGYNFNGFYDSSGNKITTIYGSDCKDYYLTARWSLKSISIKYNFDGGYYPKNVDFESDGIVISSQSIDPYTSLQYVVPAQKDGYQFIGWKLDGYTSYYNFSGTLSGYYTTKLKAQWNPIKEGCLNANINSNIENVSIDGYRITYYQITSLINQDIVVSSLGNVDVCGILFDYSMNQLAVNDDVSSSNNNFELAYSLKANTSYIIGVRGSTDDAFGTTDISINSNSESIYPVSTVTGKVWGTTYVDGYSYYKYGDAIKLPPTPEKQGHRFVGWFDENGNEYHDGETIDFESNITLIAKWEEINP